MVYSALDASRMHFIYSFSIQDMESLLYVHICINLPSRDERIEEINDMCTSLRMLDRKKPTYFILFSYFYFLLLLDFLQYLESNNYGQDLISISAALAC